MPKTQVACPQCRQPILVEVQQIFDLAQDPLAKQKLLNGAVNVIHCPACGYSGMLGTPIVYHDPEKELFLTFFPPESGVPLNEQERQLGPMINRVIDALPAEKRKAYILQPKSMLTYQTLIESVLEADGITKEMLEEQQKKIHLIQRLLTAPETELETIIEQEKELIDLSFFALYSRLLQSAVAQNDEESARQLDKVQKVLFEKTEVGKELYKSSQETQQAIKELQEAGKDGGLTREKLLDVVLNAKSDAALSAIVSLARNGMDYTFFQLLSQKIDAAKDKEKESLVGIASGLAWTEVGGDVLHIEVTLMKGKGALLLTGQLGDIMKESAQAGYTYVRSKAQKIGITEDFHEKYDIHVHVPEGAIPKDGPSAGITMATALASSISGRKIRSDVAMTGEITLRGRVLPVGGIKEKVMAAHRAGYKVIILPEENKKDLEDISPNIRKELEFILVDHMDKVLDAALEEGDQA